VDPDGRNPFLVIPLALILTDTYLNAPETENDIYDGLTPENEFGLCLIGGKVPKDYVKKNYHAPHNQYGPHIHWGPKRNPHPQAPRKWHAGPKNPNHGQPKGQSGWQGWKDWNNKGRPWGWK
jgi:hypothetical protein